MLRDDLYAELRKLPVIDVHTHVDRDHMAATGLEQVMFYHMLMYPLRGAGVTEERMWPEEEAARRGLPFEEWIEHWPAVAHTGFGWILKTILRELYDFDEPVTAGSFPRLQAAFAEKTSQADWPRQVLDKANVVRLASSVLDVAPIKPGEWDGRIRFTIEDAPSCGKTEYTPWARRLAGLGEILGREVASVERMREAMDTFYDRFDWTGKAALVAWVGAEADFTPVSDAAVDGVIADCLAGREVDGHGRRVLEAAFVRAICRAMRGRTGIFQFCYGTQYLLRDPLYAHPIQRAAPQFASTMGHLFGEFPDIHFNVLNGFEPHEPIWCGMVQGYGNVSLANFWWQTFYPTVIHNAVARRLEMVPLNRLVGFFSDGWCVDYVYGRLALIRRAWANVLAEKVERGFYTAEEALDVARECFFETPRRLFFPDEPIET
jgi:glucuronate isomerase